MDSGVPAEDTAGLYGCIDADAAGRVCRNG